VGPPPPGGPVPDRPPFDPDEFLMQPD